MKTRSQKILENIIRTQRVANAYVFAGADAPTKLEAAKYFARSLNCLEEILPCENCSSCKKSQKNVHPDIILVDKENSSIKIEQIRNIKEITRYGPHESKWKIVIIREADALTAEASNSFLKILEEPPPNVVFILISERKGALPQTMLSRCQKIVFEDPQQKPALEELVSIFNKINQKPLNYLEASQALSEVDNVPKFLREIFTLFASANKTRQARTVLEILKGIEKKVNQKLAMDLLCLKLWKIN